MTQVSKKPQAEAGKPGTGETPPAPGNGRAIRLKRMGDVRKELARLYTDARHSIIKADDAYKLAMILAEVRKIIEGTVLEERIAEIERKQNAMESRQP